ncbi:beta-mannosidase [Paenibacillus thalictri]|uniref:Beta-mannosidase B n=1 Tax=Paenibacillus thalictri TaxID=2527873 RepID=A0A4V2J4J5_9BACL|nr:glycoside hydrolase family 2 protein [Paenibacillus thalictri]TBL80121.1 hypothetical protein EYB31_06755 [Paenibacillus thalictri]
MKTIVELNETWEIRSFEPFAALNGEQLETGGWIPTHVPSQVHEVLLREGLIDDPAAYGKGKECLWVAEQDWIYRTVFKHTEPGKKAYLHFKGLDTLVDIFLNGTHLAYHNDMYVPIRLEVTELLRESNELVLHFHSVHEFIKHAELPEEWQGKMRPSRLIRKSEHDFVDYLGPKPYVTRVGIYDKVLLEVIDGIEITEADIAVKLSDDYRQGRIGFKVSGLGFTDGSVLKVQVRDPDGQLVEERELPLRGGVDGSQDRTWSETAELTVTQPALWWPRGHGSQPLYEVSAAVWNVGEARDRVVKRIGFRHVRMAKPFDFEINGRRITLWGAQSAQIQGITHCWNNEKSNRLLDLLENANMNAQRIWGGADRYDDAFYDEADRRGILLWQEFFHDYGMFPDSREYRELCVKEAEYQVKRLKHRPSLLFWCGGNECFMGAEYEQPGVPYIGGAIFLEDYKRVCETLDPDRYYHINSPYGGAYCNDPLAGDTHSYTNTWYVPGADYPIMIAEEIRTSPPAVKSFLRYMGEDKAWPADYSGMITSRSPYPWPDTWTERTSAFGWKKIPPIELFYDSDSLESAVYKFGAAHAYYLRNIIENNRRGKPSSNPEGERICKGHFVCRWNDSWQVIYGSMIDYYLEPYMPYYAVKRAYEPVLLTFDVQNFIYCWAVNDSADDVAGTLHVRLFHPSANAFVNEIKRKVRVGAGESKLVCDLNEFKQFSREYILFAQLVNEHGDVVSRTNDFVDIEKKLRFPEAKLHLTMKGNVLTVTTDKFARCVQLSGSDQGDEFGWLFEDNYFDLLPGEVKRVRILGSHRSGTITAKPYYSPLASTIEMAGNPDKGGN